MIKFSKTHKVQFFCNKEVAQGIPEPYLNSQHFPEWFSKTPKIKCPLRFLHDNSVTKSANIKGCPGITDLLSSGYTIPAWTNFVFREIDNQLYVNWENGNLSDYKLHSKNDYEGMSSNEQPLYGGFHKISSPWAIKTSPGISCLIIHPYWNRDSRFTNVSAIQHTDITPSPIKWFFEWNYQLHEKLIEPDLQIIRKGHPLMYIFPFKREKYALNIKYLKSEEYSSLISEYVNKTNDWFNNSLYNQCRKKIGKLFF